MAVLPTEADGANGADDVMATCYRCYEACNIFQMIVKSSSAQDHAKVKYICRPCNAIATMLTRNMTWPPEFFSSLPEEQQQKFWSACKEGHAETGRFSYSKVRATLVKTLTHQKTVEDTEEVWSEALPLDVWVKQGWKAEDIMAKAKKEINAVAGEVFAVPVQRSSTKVTVATIETHVQKAEQKISAKRKLPDEPAGDGDGDEDVLCSEDETVRMQTAGSRKPKPKAAPKKQAKAASKKKAREEKVQSTKNQSLHAFAVKAVMALSLPVLECNLALDAIKAAPAGSFPDMVKTNVQQAYDDLSTYKEAASKVAAVRVRDFDGVFELPFDHAQLSCALAGAKSALRLYTEMQKLMSR